MLGPFWALIIPLTVSVNDIFAYFCGKTWGRTKLIGLSPNKTVEGFVGGAISTGIFTILITALFFDKDNMICMVKQIPLEPFHPII